MNEAANHALSKAKIQLMTRADSAFFTTVCFSLKQVWDDSIPTAATDGTTIYFNTQFFMNLSTEERVFLLLHESMHVAYLHMDRLNERDHKKWNIAADHVINLMLKERGFKMPTNGLADPMYIGLSTEEVYKLLPEQKDILFDMDLQPSDQPSEALNQAVQDILVRAAIQSKMQEDRPGSIPGELEIFLNGLLDPKLPWQRILQKYLHAKVKNDYTFKKPNRRFFPTYHLPSLYSEGLMDIAVAVDTSGSVTDADFQVFISEVHSILKMMKPEKITLVQFDTALGNISEHRNISSISHIKFVGRGGTKIGPVLKWASEKKPKLLLVFSDGYFRFKDATVDTETLWIIHNNPKFTAPKGKVIHYKV